MSAAGTREPPGSRLRRESLRLLIKQRLGEEISAASASRLISEHGRVDEAFRFVAADVERRRRSSSFPRVHPRSPFVPAIGVAPREAIFVARYAPQPLRFGALVVATMIGIALATYTLPLGSPLVMTRAETALTAGFTIAFIAATAYAARLWSLPVSATPAATDVLLDLAALLAIVVSQALPAIAILQGGDAPPADWNATSAVLSLLLLGVIAETQRVAAG